MIDNVSRPYGKMMDKNSFHSPKYRGADKSLARRGRKQANVSVRMA